MQAMDYGSIVYVTPDDVWRNAIVTDHRGPTTRPGSWTRPTIVSTAPAPTVTTMTPATVAPPAPYPYQYPTPGYPTAGYPTPGYSTPGLQPTWTGSGWWNPAQPPYVTPPVMGSPSNLATILGGFGDLGSLANILAQ